MADSAPVAYPEWTGAPRKRGLDPLGMQSTSVSLYQDLVPGISNVTLRIRYYGLYAWLSWIYAGRIGSTDPEQWKRFVRRAEALYALIAQHTNAEVGIAGTNWAFQTLQGHQEGDISFAAAADPGNSPAYLKQAFGAFGAAYGSQLLEIGILELTEKHPVPVPSQKLGEPLAKVFSDAAGPLVNKFFDVIQRGVVSIPELVELAPLAPSAIAADSPERELYERILFASYDGNTVSDGIDRRHTLLLALDLAARFKRIPSADDLRWALYAGMLKDGQTLRWGSEELRLQARRWWVYQANDLAHVSLETLLKFILDLLANYPSGRSLDALVSEAVTQIIEAAPPRLSTWDDFLESLSIPENAWSETTGSEWQIAQQLVRIRPAAAMCSAAHALQGLTLLGILHKKFSVAEGDIRQALGKFDRRHWHSLMTEIDYIEPRRKQPLAELVAELITNRVIRRHLWVAAQKLRFQDDYTFLMDADEGKIRLRDKDGPVLTNPRLGPAITFLRDIHLIDANGLTALGEKMRRAA